MSYVLVKDQTPVTRIILNNPRRRNPLGMETIREVIAALNNLGPDCQAVVIAGEGPVFSAGHDLKEMIDPSPGFVEELFDVCTEMMMTIHRVPQPVVARVHGPAFAAGCQLVASCDLAVAVDTATFATPGVKIGLFCSTPMVPLSRAVGRKRALEMLLTGTPIDALTAREWGLVNRVVSPAELDDTLDGLLEQLTKSSPAVVGLGKAAFYQQVEMAEEDAYGYTKKVMTANAVMNDAQEGMGAFIEKRTPVWSGS
jgi:enoyl-CoA hydratase/carnithine racemase